MNPAGLWDIRDMETGIGNGCLKNMATPCACAPSTNHVTKCDENETCYPLATNHRRRATDVIPRPVRARSGRKLVLHMDVRNTILVADSVDKVSVEQALNSFLTGVTWGRDTESGWEWYSEQPSLRCPHPDTITYYKHLEKRLVRVPSDRAVLRRVTGDFTQEDIGRKFVAYFENHLKRLEWRHPGEGDPFLTMQGKDGKLYHYILPSFYRLIERLHQNGRNFSIVIRTYGLDAPNVLQSMSRTLQGQHPEFPNALPIKVNLDPGKIIRRLDTITAQIGGESSSGSITSRYRGDRAIYDLMCCSTGVSAYVDDFRYWQANDYRSNAGKPLWIDPSRTDVQHIFFDDNIRVTDSDSIVDVRVFDSPTSQSARSLPRQETTKFEDMCLVQADLLQSTSNADYFINKVEACEKKFDQYVNAVGKR